MTAQGITSGAGSAMNVVFSGFSAVGGSVKGMQETSFEQFMETSKNGSKESSDAPTYKQEGVKEEYTKPMDVKERAKELFSGESRVKETETTSKTEPIAKSAEEAPELSEEELEAISALFLQVQTVVCEELGITKEELSEAMDELGLEPTDLLQRESLQQLFLNVNRAEPTEFLTNETLFERFSELMQSVEQAVEVSGISPDKADSAKHLITEWMQQTAKESEPDTAPAPAEKTDVPVTELIPTEPAVVQNNEEVEKVQTVPAEKRNSETVENDEKSMKEETIIGEPEETVVVREPAEPQTETTEVQEDIPETEEVISVSKDTETASEGKAETGNTGEETHMTEAGKAGKEKVISSENDSNVRNAFIDTLANYAVNEAGEASPEVAAQVREIANQIMEQIKITIRPEQTNMELQLNPEHLGRVNLTITEKEGMMTAQFTTQTEIAKEAIESQMTALRESLQNQGIKVEAIEVTVSEFGFEQNQDARQNGNGEPEKRRQTGSFRMEETEDGTPQTAEYLNVTDSSVDYSA